MNAYCFDYHGISGTSEIIAGINGVECEGPNHDRRGNWSREQDAPGK